MHLEQKTAPASIADALLPDILDHLRHVHDLDASPAEAPPDVAHIERLIDSAVAFLDGPEGKIRRALITQTWVAHFSEWCREMPLRLPPVQSVVSVKYKDPDGYVQTLGASKYRLIGASSWDPVVSPEVGENWPEAQAGNPCIRIEFTAGYGPAADDLPRELIQAVRLLVAHHYMNREAVGVAMTETPIGFAELIQPHRIYR